MRKKTNSKGSVQIIILSYFIYGEINQNKVASCFSFKDIIKLMCFEHITFKLQIQLREKVCPFVWEKKLKSYVLQPLLIMSYDMCLDKWGNIAVQL